MADARQERLAHAAQMQNRLRRSLYVVGALAEELQGVDDGPVVVGGMAVEFYTLGAYATQDIDIVCPIRPEAIAALERFGFERTPSRRHWYHGGLELVIEIPDETLAGDPDRITTVEVDGLEARVIGVEDLVLDRLRAYVHWNSEGDGEWARRLMALHADVIDWEYLAKQAVGEGLGEALSNLDPR